jgi:hypothetical protein
MGSFSAVLSIVGTEYPKSVVFNLSCSRTPRCNFSSTLYLQTSTLDICVLGYICILYHKEHPPEVWHIPPGTSCILNFTYPLRCFLVPP